MTTRLLRHSLRHLQHHLKRRYLHCAGIFIFLLVNTAHADYSMHQTSKGQFLLLNERQESLLQLHTLAFEPNWKWTYFEQIENTEIEKGHQKYRYKMGNTQVTWDLHFRELEKDITISSQLNTDSTTAITYLSLSLVPEKILHTGYITLTDKDGRTYTSKAPLKVKNFSNINQLKIFSHNHQEILHIDFSAAVNIHQDHSLRIKLAEKEVLKGANYKQKITLRTPKKTRFYGKPEQAPKQLDHSSWFTWQPQHAEKSNSLSMKNWLNSEKNHSFKKTWGTNVEFIHVAPTKKNAKRRSRFFADNGINGVRLHKLTNPGWEGLGSEESASLYDSKKMVRFDYWLYELKKHGISYGFSPIWDLRIFEGDRDKLAFYDEIVKAKPNKPVTNSLVWFAKDIQQLHIETMVNLLNHKNPHTGLRYADDPSLTYFEIQNEDNIFFYTFFPTIKKYPSYHKLLAEQFSDWLTQKYRDHSGLVRSWGASAIDTFKHEGAFPNEQLQQRNISPILNPWFYDNQASRGYRAKRLQDTAEFLFKKQQEYYSLATQAIRNTGFKGNIVRSNWQAGSKGAHFLNLLSDAKSGIIDRHNYQGGAKGNPYHTSKSGFQLNNYTMLGDPGSGLLSVGMQQVSNTPFMYSEWLAVVPSEWAAADTSIVAAYGFGLQGWDMSYHFATNGDEFSPQLTFPSDKKFNTLTPVGVGLYPVLSRMVLRNDITEAAPLAIRRLSKKQAIKNTYDFENSVTQEHDVKSVTGTPHHHALAAGKVLIEFTEKDSRSTIDHQWKQKYTHINSDGSKTITSSTNELKWTFKEGTQRGFVEINSKGTQGTIGFTKNQNYLFNDLSVHPHSPYSVILTTAKSPTGTLSTDKEAIIVAIARAHNTDMNIVGSLISNMGQAPIILEPVKATLTFKRKGKIIVLDHSGSPTGVSYPLDNGRFELDTERDKTIYYLVKFDD